MPLYMIQAAYTSEAWAAMAKNPVDRTEAITRLLDAVGGRFVAAYLSFGEYDAVVIAEVPDSVTAAAVSIRAIATGHVKTLRTTPLLTIEEGVEAMRTAGTLDYSAPG